MAEQFYGLPFWIDYVPRSVPKSDQLINLCNNIADEYFILLEDDFYFVDKVNLNLLRSAFTYCEANCVDRFSLQTKNAHMCSDWHPTKDCIEGNRVYCSTPKIVIPFSLEASIWRRKFLLDSLPRGMSDSQIEIQCSARVRQTEHMIRSLDKSIMTYMDAQRDGSQLIHVIDHPLQIHVSINEKK